MGDQDATTRLGSTAKATAHPAPRVAGYVVERALGRGGMGIVWHAKEIRFDRDVALKVHLAAAPDVTDMWKEARLTAKVNDPGVVKVFDVGYTLDGHPYYTMEYVDGTDLHAILRDGRMNPADALRIAIDVSRAVQAAHEKGIVHRDLKPRNVMLDSAQRPRILDFGIAIRTAVASDAALVAGSPPYMSPEQIDGRAVGPAADIYAIGVLLYEMLTGKRPFEARDEPQLLHRIRTEDAPAPSAIVPVHPDLEAVVLRCLAKSAADRFASAALLLDALESVRDGRPPAERVARDVVEPKTYTRSHKPSRADARRTFEWKWELKSSPAALWSYVADTDRFNEAVGLGEVEVEVAREAPDTTARVGHASVKGMAMEWREYPFEWIRDREHTVFRWYRAGPLEALWNRVTLVPHGTGTELTHEIALIPRGVLGRVAVSFEIGQRLRRAMDRMYRHIDDVLVANGGDPYDQPHAPSPTERARIEAGRIALKDFPEPAVNALCNMLLHTPARKLNRMRPFALAEQFGVSRDAALAVMLHAAHVGLLEIAWDVVCPTCLVAHETERHLDGVKQQSRCASCETEFHQDLCSSVELVFRAHPEIRQTSTEMYCGGSPARRPHIFAQVVLDPGQERVIDLTLPPGDYSVAGSGNPEPAELSASPVGHTSASDVIVSGNTVVLYPPVVRGGETRFRFVNDTPDERTVRIETRRGRPDAVPAALALTHPTFRDYFRSELLDHGELVGVSHLYFLVVDASDRGSLFAERGDAEACAALRTFEANVARCAREENGTVIPGILETLVAAFTSSTRAIRAALAVLRSTDLPARLAVHGGKCLALTRDSRVDYFGETLHRAIWFVGVANASELVLSHAVASERDVSVELSANEATTSIDTSTAGPYKGRRIMRVRLK